MPSGLSGLSGLTSGGAPVTPAETITADKWYAPFAAPVRRLLRALPRLEALGPLAGEAGLALLYQGFNPLTVPLRRLARQRLEGGAVGPFVLGATTYFSDTFTDTNATALESHTSDTGQSWTKLAAGWSIVSNKLVLVAGGEYYSSVVTPADYTLTYTINLTGAGSQDNGPVMHFNPSGTTGYLISTQPGGNVLIREFPSFSVLASGAAGLTAGVDYPVTVTIAGSTITVVVNGVTVQTSSASNYLTQTGLGFYAESTGSTVDNLLIVA